MKVKTKGIFGQVSGRIGSIDRTIGRDGGLSVNVQNRRSGLTLTSKKAATRGGSEARHERSRIYCDCDTEYKGIFETKREYLNPYFQASHNLKSVEITPYMTFMKLCLGARIEKGLFEEFSYFSRYLVANMTGENWINKVVRLTGIPTKRPDGKDVQAFATDIDYNITAEIPHKVDATGSILIEVTQASGSPWLFVDVYSYSEYQHLEKEIPVPAMERQNITNATFIANWEPDTNFGQDSLLAIRYDEWSGINHVYVELPTGTGEIHLFLYVIGGEPFPYDLYIYKTGEFNEDILTWNNRPQQGEFIRKYTINSTRWIEIILSDPGKYIVIKPEIFGFGCDFRSDETRRAPYIMSLPEPLTSVSAIWKKQIGVL